MNKLLSKLLRKREWSFLSN